MVVVKRPATPVEGVRRENMCRLRFIGELTNGKYRNNLIVPAKNKQFHHPDALEGP